MATDVINLRSRGARGESFGDVARRVGLLAGLPVASSATDAQVLDVLYDGLVDVVEAAGYTVIAAVDTATGAGDGNITLSGEQTIAGVTTSTSRVLLTDQTDPAENGIWVTAAGAWARATDFDQTAEVVQGSLVPVLYGENAGSFVLITADPITVGTTGQVWMVRDLRDASKINYDVAPGIISRVDLHLNRMGVYFPEQWTSGVGEGTVAGGGSDDSTAINEMDDIAATNGGKLLLRNTYRVESQLLMSADWQFEGGTIIRDWTSAVAADQYAAAATIRSRGTDDFSEFYVDSGPFIPTNIADGLSLSGNGHVLMSTSARAYYDANSSSCAPQLYMLCDNFRLDQVKFALGGNAWTIAFGGNDARIGPFTIYCQTGDPNVIEDGFHMFWGSGLRGWGWDIESGDDSISFSNVFNSPITDCVVLAPRVFSHRVTGVKIAAGRSGSVTPAYDAVDQVLEGIQVLDVRWAPPEARKSINAFARIDARGTTVATVTASISDATLDVTAVTSGMLEVGCQILAPGIEAGTYITALGTGTGGIGTYTVSISQNFPSGTVTAQKPGIIRDCHVTFDASAAENNGLPTGAAGVSALGIFGPVEDCTINGIVRHASQNAVLISGAIRSGTDVISPDAPNWTNSASVYAAQIQGSATDCWIDGEIAGGNAGGGTKRGALSIAGDGSVVTGAHTNSLICRDTPTNLPAITLNAACNGYSSKDRLDAYPESGATGTSVISSVAVPVHLNNVGGTIERITATPATPTSLAIFPRAGFTLERTVADGAITIHGGGRGGGLSVIYKVLCEGGVSDTLTTISNGRKGDRIIIKSGESSPATVVLTVSSAGNIPVGASRTEDSADSELALVYDGTNWQEERFV